MSTISQPPRFLFYLTSMTITCRVCDNDRDNRKHRAREMMFGTRDEFDYVECAACGTLQIAEIPDLAPYYPKNYYSLGTGGDGVPRSFAGRVGARLAGVDIVFPKLGLRRLLPRSVNEWAASQVPEWLREPIDGLGFGSRILDFGSGGGGLLNKLSVLGFRDLTGADAFIDRDLAFPNGVRIVKRSLVELEPAFDLVMLHHSFEHLPDPRVAIREIARLTAHGGNALIRIPLKAAAWEKYGVNWVQLDPPRHLYLFTEASFRRIAEDAGFEVAKVVHDSSAFQFYASEEYSRDIAMSDEASFKGDISKSIFTTEQIANWTAEASQLNAKGRGDQACFYLRKRS